MNAAERQRRHDERWQTEILDGMARTLAVLHDISDHLQQLTRQLATQPATPPTAPDTDDDRPLLFSVNTLADHLGIAPSAVRGLHYTGHGPPVTKLASRVYYHRDDVTTWLNEQRPEPVNNTQPWRNSYIPGRIGANHPRSSEPTKRPWCDGSHTEPLAASCYSGRAVCRTCEDDVLVNNNGLLRKHHPRWW